MKLETDQAIHLTYCTNIHPGEHWQQVFSNLQRYCPALQARISPGKAFGIGLRLSDVASQELLNGDQLPQFQRWLEQHNLYVFTLNGFPYGSFHDQVVKDSVYAPDWSQVQRLNYTRRLIQILAALLPVGLEGSISTSPLSYKPWFKSDPEHQAKVLSSSSLHLAELVAELVQLESETGKRLYLALEPEPDGLLEDTSDVINYFQMHLLPIAQPFLQHQLGVSSARAATYVLNHIRLCYDTCHFSVAYEEPLTAFQQLQAAGIQIGKVQLSTALQLEIPTSIQSRRHLTQQLRPFAESTYLHQVVARARDRTLVHYPDLELALPDLEHTSAIEWRIHFHVPIFLSTYLHLSSTQQDTVTALNMLLRHPICQHLEIETYTWEVLPPALQLDLTASIQREYEWVLQQTPTQLLSTAH
jgi:hypothetical protein